RGAGQGRGAVDLPRRRGARPPARRRAGRAGEEARAGGRPRRALGSVPNDGHVGSAPATLGTWREETRNNNREQQQKAENGSPLWFFGMKNHTKVPLLIPDLSSCPSCPTQAHSSIAQHHEANREETFANGFRPSW